MAYSSLVDKRSSYAQLLETLEDVLRLLDARSEHIAAAYVDSAVQHLTPQTHGLCGKVLAEPSSTEGPIAPGNASHDRVVTRAHPLTARTRPPRLQVVQSDKSLRF